MFINSVAGKKKKKITSTKEKKKEMKASQQNSGKYEKYTQKFHYAKKNGILPVGVKPLGVGCAVEAWPRRLLPCPLGAGCLLKELLS